MQLQFYNNLLTKTIFTFFLVIPNMEIVAKQKTLVLFERVECQNLDVNITQSLKCFFLKHDITKHLMLNAEAKFAKQFDDVTCKIKITLERFGNTIKLHESELDICVVLSQRLDNYILRMVLEEFHRASNIPVHCPFKANYLYNLRNFTINSKYYPAFIPDSKWTAVLNISSNQHKVFSAKTFGKIVRKNV